MWAWWLFHNHVSLLHLCRTASMSLIHFCFSGHDKKRKEHVATEWYFIQFDVFFRKWLRCWVRTWFAFKMFQTILEEVIFTVQIPLNLPWHTDHHLTQRSKTTAASNTVQSFLMILCLNNVWSQLLWGNVIAVQCFIPLKFSSLQASKTAVYCRIDQCRIVIVSSVLDI